MTETRTNDTTDDKTNDTKIENPDAIKDDTTKIVGDVKDAVKDETIVTDDTKDKATKTEIDEARYQEALKAQETFNSILEEHGYDDVAELNEDLSTGKSLKELLGDADAGEIKKKADTLDKYEAHWQQQEEKKRQEEEEPDDTISRLQRENKALKIVETERQAKASERQRAETAIKTFNTTVSSEIDKADLPKEYHAFASIFLGVDNPANDVDVGKKTEIRSFAKDGIRSLKAFEQTVIKNYLAGKIEITKVAPTDTTKTPVKETPKNTKGLEGLRERFLESFGIKTD